MIDAEGKHGVLGAATEIDGALGQQAPRQGQHPGIFELRGAPDLGKPRRIGPDLRRVPPDPFGEPWGKRAYASPPDDPREGERFRSGSFITIYLSPRHYHRIHSPIGSPDLHGKELDLTATEYKLLRFLMRNPRRVLSKAQILDHVWDYDFGGDGGVVETYIGDGWANRLTRMTLFKGARLMLSRRLLSSSGYWKRDAGIGHACFSTYGGGLCRDASRRRTNATYAAPAGRGARAR